MKRFLARIVKFSAILTIPLLIIACVYMYYDPFRIVKQYNDYSYSPFTLNRDFVSTEMFRKNNQKYQYNSFLFGSSRTIAYHLSSWQKYLPAGSKPYSFDASGETFWGINKKLKYLNNSGAKLDNVLIILCHDVSFSSMDNSKGHLLIKSPVTSGESALTYHLTFFKAFLSPLFLKNFIVYKFTGKYDPSMEGYVEHRKILYDTITNQAKILSQDAELAANPDAFYNKRRKLFYARKGEHTDSVGMIKKDHIILLREVAEILKKHHTKYKVVISPLYDQIKFNPTDIKILKETFGNNLYNFSGSNSFTDSYRNFYENSHYRPMIGDSILKIIYK